MASQTTWDEYAIAITGTLIVALLGPYLPELMPLFGLRGAFVNAIFFAPLIIYTIIKTPGNFWLAPIGAFSLLVLVHSVSWFWSNETIDAEVNAFAALTTITWAALLSKRPNILRVVIRTSAFYCFANAIINLAAPDALPGLNVFTPIVSLFGDLYLEEAKSADGKPRVPLIKVPYYFAFFAMIVLSTFRSPALGSAGGLLVCSARSSAVRVTAVVVALVALGVFGGDTQTRTGYIERSDIQGRYQTIGVDRLSNRQDIWENVATDIATDPSWIAHGVGLGDVAYYVASVNPQFAVTITRNRRAVLHSHNTFLEFFLATGLLGLPFMIAAFGGLIKMTRWASAAGGLAVTVLFISFSGVPFLDLTGGNLAFGMMLALVAIAKPARKPPTLPAPQHT